MQAVLWCRQFYGAGSLRVRADIHANYLAITIYALGHANDGGLNPCNIADLQTPVAPVPFVSVANIVFKILQRGSHIGFWVRVKMRLNFKLVRPVRIVKI